MGFLHALTSGYRNYANFHGRARRPEFWFFYLFNLVVVVGPFAVGLGLTVSNQNAHGPGSAEAFVFGTLLSLLAMLVNFLPMLALTVRRIHDTGHSGWVALLYLLPQLGVPILLVWCAFPGTDGDNLYGPSPLGSGPAVPAPA
jgi:uncharacterized membrane protein YhaH (DUF805 family)